MNIKEYFKIRNEKKFREIDLKSIRIICGFICDRYEQWGIAYDKENREIINSYKDAPRFCLKEDNPGYETDIINITPDLYTYWCQVIYQLAHELTHCFIYCNNKSKEQRASWIEESICELMAFYFLGDFFANWDECELKEITFDYKNEIKIYLEGELNREGTSRLSRCSGNEELMYIEKTAQEHREDRLCEVKKMYNLFADSDIEGLIKYKDFVIPNKKILDTKKYKKMYEKNNVVKYLCELQDNILKS